MNPADCLPVLLLGQPVFRKVHARDHPIPSTVISISGTRFSVALEKKITVLRYTLGLQILESQMLVPGPSKIFLIN